MIKFRKLSDDHPDLNHSPLLRAAILTLRYVQDHGPITPDSRNVHHVFKTPLWRSALKLYTDDILEPVQMH